jgi:phosphopantetheinyl transferase
MTKLLVCNVSGVTEGQFAALLALASPERKKRAAGYHKREAAVCCLAAEALLRYAFPDRNPETLQKEPGGKPFWEGVHFNLSHSGPWVVLAMGDSPVGVDVECFCQNRNVEALAKRQFTPEEQRFVGSSQERFLRIWTAKEARLKWDGTGLRVPTNSFPVLDDPMGKTWFLPDGVLTLWASDPPETWEKVEICEIVPSTLELYSLQDTGNCYNRIIEINGRNDS